MFCIPLRRMGVALTVLAGGLVLFAQPSAQLSTPTRVLVSEVAPDAIDRGLSPRDARRPPEGRTRVRPSADDGANEPSYVRGKVIVKFRGDTTGAARSRAASRAGARVVERPDYANFEVLTIGLDEDPEAVAADLASDPAVEYAQAAYRPHLRFRPNDPLYAQQWNLSLLDMERTWDINPGASSNIIVAVLDEGVAFQSAIYDFRTIAWRDESDRLYPSLGVIRVPFAAAPDLAGPNRFVAPRDFIWNDNNPVDFGGHGTHVSGTIGQLTNNGLGVAGMAFNVRIMPVKVIENPWDFIFDSPYISSDDTLARGIRYAVDNGARVLNMSLGRYGPPAPVVEDAVRYGVGRGAVLVFAAGNDFARGNPQDDVYNIIAERVAGAISVGAVTRDRAHAFYSNTGHVEVVGPGGDTRTATPADGILQQTLDSDFILSFLMPPAAYVRTLPRFDIFAYEFSYGNSMATPHVSGFAALLMQQGITDPAAIEAAMTMFADDLGTPGHDNTFGHGLINPRKTLRGLGVAK